MIIPKNKLNVETGIMISKIPFDENLEITYEYFAWLGKHIKPIVAKTNHSVDYTKVRVKVLTIRERAIYIETKLRKQLWIPKSLIKSNEIINTIAIGEWYNLEIARWFHKNKNGLFGIA